MNNSRTMRPANGKMAEAPACFFDDPGVRSFMVEVVYRCLGVVMAWIRKRYGLRE